MKDMNPAEYVVVMVVNESSSMRAFFRRRRLVHSRLMRRRIALHFRQTDPTTHSKEARQNVFVMAFAGEEE